MDKFFLEPDGLLIRLKQRKWGRAALYGVSIQLWGMDMVSLSCPDNHFTWWSCGNKSAGFASWLLVARLAQGCLVMGEGVLVQSSQEAWCHWAQQMLGRNVRCLSEGGAMARDSLGHRSVSPSCHACVSSGTVPLAFSVPTLGPHTCLCTHS